MAAIGRILLMPKGDYSGSAVYNSLDWVRHDGAAWVCKLDGTTGIAPSTSATTNWQLMAEDGTVGGWTSITGKPFTYIGKGLDVDGSSTLFVDSLVNYIGSSDRPISGQGVADALDDYYDKTAVDNKLKVVVKYGGTKTFADLTSSLAVATNENNFYLLTDNGYITSSNINYWSDAYVVGDHILKDSHIAVIKYTGSDSSKNTYVFDDFGGFVEVDEWTSTATLDSNNQVTFDDLNSAYGYALYFDDQDTTRPSPLPKYTSETRSAGTNTGMKLVYTIQGGTIGTSKFRLRILK